MCVSNWTACIVFLKIMPNLYSEIWKKFNVIEHPDHSKMNGIETKPIKKLHSATNKIHVNNQANIHTKPPTHTIKTIKIKPILMAIIRKIK